MADHLQALFEAIRQACTTAVWSRGVELTRSDTVIHEREDPDEVVFRISSRGGMLSFTVTLFLDDVDWDCQCDSSLPGCEHVAAAIISLRRARREGRALRTAEDAGRIEYHFTRSGHSLAFERRIVRGGESQPLTATLAGIASGRVAGPRFVASQADLAAELALGTHRRGVLPRPLLGELLQRLARCEEVFLDGRKVGVSPEPTSPRVRVSDQGEGFRLAVEEDPDLDEAFDNGLALCGETLRPTTEARLTGREAEQFLRGRYFSIEQVTELVTELLPALEKRIPLVIDTERLPKPVSEPPRVQLRLEAEGRNLIVLATIVYGRPPTARIDGGRLVHLQGAIPGRDVAAEKQLIRRLSKELDLAPGVREELVAEQAVRFCDKLEPWKRSVLGNGHHAFRRAPALEVRVAIGEGSLEVTFQTGESAGGSPRVSLGGQAEVIRAWRAGESLVPLAEGGWAPLPLDWLARHGHRVADLLAARDALGRVPRCVTLDLARLADELDQPPPPDVAGLRDRLKDFAGIPASELPGDLTATLRPYQQRGVDWLNWMGGSGLGVLLADDMGLGKTVQALCAIRGRTLVACPTSVLHNWATEIERHRPGLSHSVYHGPKRSLDPTADVTLTTYAILRLDADRLRAENWETLILDESQAIKNPDSRVAAAAYGIPAAFRVALTGTPVENRLDELWSQFHFINRGLLGGRSDFQERYATPIACGDGEAAARLRERIRPFVLRRLKSEVAPELPPRTEVVLRCELSEAERLVYDTVRAATLSDVVARLKLGEGVMAALEALLRMRQAACHPALVPGHEASNSAKTKLLMETLDNAVAEGHKALVFSQWTSFLDLVEPHLEQAGVDFVRLDGTTRDRGAVVRQFQDEQGPPVMLISLKAGGTGLNLTAADHVLLLDPWWNPAVEDQAADRAHRIGQDRPVMIYRLVAEGTVEERILDLQTRKRALADAALGEAGGAAGITRDDLLELLAD